jgi:hypothetical protein
VNVERLIEDAIAQAVCIAEALGDGEYYLAAFIAEDLERDLSEWLKTSRSATSSRTSGRTT